MGIARGPNIVTKDLVMAVDCDAVKSYPGSGTTLFDLTGNNNDVTLQNGASISNGKASFDGTDDRAVVADTTMLEYTPTDSFTVMAVFSLVTIQEFTDNQFATGTTLFGRGSTGGSVGLGLRRETNGQLRIYAGSRGVSQITDAYDIDANRIYSTTFSYTPTIQKLYVNGEFQSSSDTSAGAGGSFDDTFWAIFYPRAVPGGNSKYGEGDFYLGRLYSRELTAAEVKQNFNGIKNRFGL
jgi:hypothetical protein